MAIAQLSLSEQFLNYVTHLGDKEYKLLGGFSLDKIRSKVVIFVLQKGKDTGEGALYLTKIALPPIYVAQ
jgi:hypothetical protein